VKTLIENSSEQIGGKFWINVCKPKYYEMLLLSKASYGFIMKHLPTGLHVECLVTRL
jgi:hypothetical protein